MGDDTTEAPQEEQGEDVVETPEPEAPAAPKKAPRKKATAKADAPPTGFFLTEGGSVIEMDLPLPEAIAQRVLKGAIIQVADADGTPLEEPVAPADPNAVDRVAVMAPPPRDASKAVWVGYAVKFGGMTPDAADAMTKADLIERFTK